MGNKKKKEKKKVSIPRNSNHLRSRNIHNVNTSYPKQQFTVKTNTKSKCETTNNLEKLSKERERKQKEEVLALKEQQKMKRTNHISGAGMSFGDKNEIEIQQKMREKRNRM